MIYPTGFAAQNWVITPVATAVGQVQPTRIQDQTWELLLSGVVLIDMKGVTTAQWRRETILIVPDLNGPILQAAAHYGIPLPPGTSGSNYYCNFQVEQHAPFSTVSSIYNQGESINSGFAVDVFRRLLRFPVGVFGGLLEVAGALLQLALDLLRRAFCLLRRAARHLPGLALHLARHVLGRALHLILVHRRSPKCGIFPAR